MINAEIAIKDLLKIQKILEEIDVKFFLCEGTLLGAIRENKFLDHDKDIDIGIFYKNAENTNEILESLKQHFKISHIWQTPDLEITEITLNTSVKIDIFCYFQENSNLYNVCFKHKNNQEYLSKKYYYEKFDLVSKEFLGYKFFIPDDSVKYLTTKYGDYKIVKTDWDWFYSPLNGSVCKKLNKKDILK